MLCGGGIWIGARAKGIGIGGWGLGVSYVFGVSYRLRFPVFRFFVVIFSTLPRLALPCLPFRVRLIHPMNQLPPPRLSNTLPFDSVILDRM